MYTHELGLTQNPYNKKPNPNPGTGWRGREGGGGGREQGWGRRKASGPEPRPRNSEPDLIGAWRRELERGGHSAGRLRDARERKSGRGGPRTASAASQRPAEPSARPGLRRPRPRSGPRPTTTPRVASPSGASPSSFPPAPTRPALTQGRRSGPGPARHLRRRAASPRRTRTHPERQSLRSLATPLGPSKEGRGEGAPRGGGDSGLPARRPRSKASVGSAAASPSRARQSEHREG